MMVNPDLDSYIKSPGNVPKNAKNSNLLKT